MYIRNRKFFLIAMGISIVFNVFGILGAFFTKGVVEGISEWMYIFAIIASLFCGAIPIVLGSFTRTWSHFTILSLPGIALVGMFAAIVFSLCLCAAIILPGLISLIGYFKYGSML